MPPFVPPAKRLCRDRPVAASLRQRESVERMALSLKDQETDSLARQVASPTGETLTEAVRGALRLRLRDEQLKRGERPWNNAAIERYNAPHRRHPHGR